MARRDIAKNKKLTGYTFRHRTPTKAVQASYIKKLPVLEKLAVQPALVLDAARSLQERAAALTRQAGGETITRHDISDFFNHRSITKKSTRPLWAKPPTSRNKRFRQSSPPRKICIGTSVPPVSDSFSITSLSFVQDNFTCRRLQAARPTFCEPGWRVRRTC